MLNLLAFVLLFLAFYFLGRSADIVILNVRRIAEQLGIRIFFLGLILGFFTSLPEIGIGFSAAFQNISEVAFGNLLGGILVLFGAILGISAILERTIPTERIAGHFFPITVFLLLPVVLGINGIISEGEGLLLIGLYLGLLYYLYRTHGVRSARISPPSEKMLLKSIFFVIIGLILVMLLSSSIIKLTTYFLAAFFIPSFILGLLIFSLGTNLPEFVIMFRSIRQKIKGLSLSNLIGSAMANIFIIGLLAFVKPLYVHVDGAYIAMAVSLAAILLFFLYFKNTDKALTKNEGISLVVLYVLFLVVQLGFLFAMK